MLKINLNISLLPVLLSLVLRSLVLRSLVLWSLVLWSLILCWPLGALASPEAATTYRWQSYSESKLFLVMIKPVSAQLPMNRFHSWSIQLTDNNDQPVNPALIDISGGMPAHKHGLPSAPEVTDYLGNGQYLIEGMKFNMPGEWLLQFSITGAEGARDTVSFLINVGF